MSNKVHIHSTSHILPHEDSLLPLAWDFLTLPHKTFNLFQTSNYSMFYGKLGHHVPQCRNNKRTKKDNPRANLAEMKVIVVAVSSEVRMVTNMKDYVVDSRSTRHICNNKSAFTSYTVVK